MKAKKIRSVAITTILILSMITGISCPLTITPAAALTEDDASIPAVSSTASHAGNKTATPTSSEDAVLKWKAKFSDSYYLGTSIISTPVVTQDTIYIVNCDKLYALDPGTGNTSWELNLGRRM
ncbi:MAG: PQQ-like beta-propeller repeat protein, partial [Eubacterium sp.]|nr:PQQ-like beta-propeller repeat protein [Eubacterium sp.]